MFDGCDNLPDFDSKLGIKKNDFLEDCFTYGGPDLLHQFQIQYSLTKVCRNIYASLPEGQRPLEILFFYDEPSKAKMVFESRCFPSSLTTVPNPAWDTFGKFGKPHSNNRQTVSISFTVHRAKKPNKLSIASIS